MTTEQFDALELWVNTEIRAALCRNSSGPHVRPAQDAANARALLARHALTGVLSDNARAALLKAGYSIGDAQ